MTEEMMELFGKLRQAGFEPVWHERHIPFYINPVHCGTLEEVGHVCREDDDDWYGRDEIERTRQYQIRAIGDSMKDAGINAGDVLTVLSGITPMEGDILLVRMDDRFAIKAYYEDNDGQAWLVPYNDAYKPIRLGNGTDYRVCGRVTAVTKNNPRVSSRDSLRRIRNMKEEERREITQERVESAIFDVSPLVRNSRQWYAVFRKLVELTSLGMAEMEEFCDLVGSVVPGHGHLPTADELQRMAVQSFVRPSRLWDKNDAPVKGKRFDDYVKIANRTEELLTAA